MTIPPDNCYMPVSDGTRIGYIVSNNFIYLSLPEEKVISGSPIGIIIQGVMHVKDREMGFVEQELIAKGAQKLPSYLHHLLNDEAHKNPGIYINTK